MTGPESRRDDMYWLLALAPPLVVRLLGDGMEAAQQRLLLLALAFAIAYGWAALFARGAGRGIGPGLPVFATGFVVMLPGPVAWTGAVLALSFGAVFGREIFGGRPILPPALIALAFAVFSFPTGGFDLRDVLGQRPDILFALSCLPGAALLAWRGGPAWQVAAGAVAGAAAAALLVVGASWWEQLCLGAFAPGILFLAAAPESAVAHTGARWLHGILVGAMIVVIRVAGPEHPDGVVFAALLGGLFAPLLARAFGGKPAHA